MYCRLVDDISIVLQCEFSNVKKIIELMATHYPNMPLNVQVSFGYSRFLYLHVYNMKSYCDNNVDYYQLCRVLAYKEMSSFSYTPWFSNISDSYKHAVVPVSLYRIHTRNSLPEDIDHHLSFMHRILKFRMQDPVQVSRKTKAFFRRKRLIGNKHLKKDFSNGVTTSVKFDIVSGRHLFMSNLMRKSCKSRLRIIYRSGSNLGSILCPKKRVIRLLSSMRDGVTE